MAVEQKKGSKVMLETIEPRNPSIKESSEKKKK